MIYPLLKIVYNKMNLENDFDSYLYGFIATDGSISLNTRNRGKVTIEISYRDKDLIEKIHEDFKLKHSIRTRVRDTNFAKEYKSIMFSCHLKEYRDFLFENGMPKEDKTNQVTVPSKPYNKFAFWRGVIDGDGSIGYTATNEPFVSLVTKSEELKNEFLKLIEEELDIIKVINRNKRDDIYNITIKNEEAIKLANLLYKDAKIYLDRKYENAVDFKNWKRTKKKINKQTWTAKEEKYILEHSLEDSIKNLNRTKGAIKCKLYKLNNSNKN